MDDTEKLGVWQPGSTVECAVPDPLTRLAATCVEEPDGSFTLQLFYQSAHRELRRTFYSSETAEWKDAALESESGGRIIPIQGSSLAASASVPTRVLYLTGPRDIALIKRVGDKWKSSKLELYRRVRAGKRINAPSIERSANMLLLEKLKRIHVAQKTPIVIAPSLIMDDPAAENGLATFFIRNDARLLGMFFNTENDNFAYDVQPEESRTEHSQASEAEVEAGGSLAVASSSDDHCLVFYQSSSTTISVYDAIRRSKVSLGIPTSEGGDPRVYNTGASGTSGSSSTPVGEPVRPPTVAVDSGDQIGVGFGSGLLNANELARFEFPMSVRLRNPSEAEHRAFSVSWTGAWKTWSSTYYAHGNMVGTRWDISELGSIVHHFNGCRPWFHPQAQETDWNRYWNMPSFRCCQYVGYQRDLWRLAKSRQLLNTRSISNEAWERILQNFSLFLWFDFYVMKYDFTNASSAIFQHIYSYLFSL